MRLLLALALLLAPAAAQADTALIAVAANFAKPAERLIQGFAAESGHQIEVSTGSTGNLAAQIRNGAPFTLFLSADERRPAELEAEGLAVAGSRFTYAVGKLVLWGPDPRWVVIDPATSLNDPELKRLAIANPELAPYGRAAEEVLTALGVWEAVEPKLVRGEDIGQTYQFVASGNAELGFVALSQVLDASGSRWEVPQDLYTPIRQQAALLEPGEGNAAAKALLDYLRSEPAREIIRAAGYGVE
ncbi:MAG: modA [Rhodospirillales bacterium]|jgi:molybdate transport system substrate-binding protein|nr:modA [Rhodospirillales bacterium]